MRDGRTEPQRKEAYLKQYVDRLSGELFCEQCIGEAVVRSLRNIAG